MWEHTVEREEGGREGERERGREGGTEGGGRERGRAGGREERRELDTHSIIVHGRTETNLPTAWPSDCG